MKIENSKGNISAPYHKEGRYIFFGEYPQSIKADGVAINDNITDDNGYCLGSDGYYYAKVTAYPARKGMTFSTGEVIEKGKSYYFKVEPIRWRILSCEGSDVLLLCDNIIEQRRYDLTSADYAESELRAWLGDAFYSRVFVEEEKACILKTHIDKNASDSIFLLTVADITNGKYGFSTKSSSPDEQRCLVASDYVRATGGSAVAGKSADAFGSWWLCGTDKTKEGVCVVENGMLNASYPLSDSTIGIAPALRLHLMEGDEIKESDLPTPYVETYQPPYQVIDEEHIAFGEYPQSLKEDHVTITSTQDHRGYYLGSDHCYYAKVVAKPLKNIPFRNKQPINAGEVYYFKVEPIRWRILQIQGNDALVFCDNILVSRAIDQKTNNYKKCELRAWLCGEFFTTAFSKEERKIIPSTTVDNSQKSTGYPISPSVPDTNDTVFLLSYKEILNPDFGFHEDRKFNDTARIIQTTDYARALGSGMSSSKEEYGAWCFWLRSPEEGKTTRTRLVGSYGGVYTVDEVYQTDNGVVPALRIHLADEDAQTLAPHRRKEPQETPKEPQKKVKKPHKKIDRGLLFTIGLSTLVATIALLLIFLLPKACAKETEYIYFGEFPQSIKAQDVTVDETVVDERGYFLGSDGAYYAKVIARPCASGYTYSTGESVASGESYYFKVEPIRWRILEEKGGNALVLCDFILDASAFDANPNQYAVSNNYPESTIRSWLISTFYTKAFSDAEKKAILKTFVDNGEIKNYNYEDTEDAIFLLSRKEATKGKYNFALNSKKDDDARRIQTSDYARASGAWMNTEKEHYGDGAWWLRTPGQNADVYAAVVIGGSCNTDQRVNHNDFGIVPAMRIRLERAERIPTVEYITFGEYPQSIKADDVTVDESASDARGYFLGSDGAYYAKVVATPLIADYTFTTGETIAEGTACYFKVEPIRWRVLTESDGERFLVCDVILDAVAFDTTSNNYEESDIRKWMNETFLTSAFDATQQNAILLSLVNNDAESTGYPNNSNTCYNTKDKIFLPSFQEMTSEAYAFDTDDSSPDNLRQRQTTDYARARGIGMETSSKNYGNGTWWTRSPDYGGGGSVRIVSRDGIIKNKGYAATESYGFVPAIKISKQ